MESQGDVPMSVPVAGSNPNGEVQKPADKGFRPPVYNGPQDLRSTAPSSHSILSDALGGDSHGVLAETHSFPALFLFGLDRSSSKHSESSEYSERSTGAVSSTPSTAFSAFSSTSSAKLPSIPSRYFLPNAEEPRVIKPSPNDLDLNLFEDDPASFLAPSFTELGQPSLLEFLDEIDPSIFADSLFIPVEFSGNNEVLNFISPCYSEQSNVSLDSIDSGYHTDRKRAHRRKKACESCRKRKRRCEHQMDVTSPKQPFQEDSSNTSAQKLLTSILPEVGSDSDLRHCDFSLSASEDSAHIVDTTRLDHEAQGSPSISKLIASIRAPDDQRSITEPGSTSKFSDSGISNVLICPNTNLSTAVTIVGLETQVHPNKQPLPSLKEVLPQTWVTRSVQETAGKSGSSEYSPDNCGALSLNTEGEFTKDKRAHDERRLPPEGNSAQQSEDSPESTTGSDDTELVEDDEELVIILAKHRLLVKYMQEFYSMFSPSCGAFVEYGHGDTTSTTSKTLARSEVSNQGQNTKTKGQKRKAGDRESTPPDEEEEDTRKKRGRSDPTPDGDKNNRLFACPFYKFDPSKYACTNTTGSKYRTCVGPGFHTIARLKQHLKRTHSIPQFQCLRCWQTFPDHGALAAHLQEETRCPKLDQPPVEGIPQQRWDMIKSRWGASWSNIFEIIFPGAPIPSPYYEIEAEMDLPRPPSPSSQEVADYEAYQRTELPRLVEAMLEAMIQARTDPLEERYKPFFLEIVRGAQSSLNQRWEMRKAQASSSRASQPPSQATVGHNLASDPQRISNPTVAQPATSNTNSSVVPPTYEIPPPLGGLAEMASWELLQETQNLAPIPPQFAYSDSGYGSQMSERWCQCGSFIDLSFGGPQDSMGYSSSSYSEPQAVPSLNQQVYPERPGSLDSGSALESPREKTVVKCSICGNWRFKQ